MYSPPPLHDACAALAGILNLLIAFDLFLPSMPRENSCALAGQARMTGFSAL